MYILECANGQYYTGSTHNLEKRLEQHQIGEGANFTRKHLPIKLVYYEEFQRIEEAFNREKQVQGWSRKKKEALIFGKARLLQELSECKNETHFRNAPRNAPFDSAPFDSAPFDSAPFDSAPFDSAQGPGPEFTNGQSPFDSAPFDSAQGPDSGP